MIAIKRSSVWFQVAFFFALQYERERTLGRLLLSLILNGGREKNEELEEPKVPSQVSLCELCWGILWAPVVIPFTLVGSVVLGVFLCGVLPAVLIVAIGVICQFVWWLLTSVAHVVAGNWIIGPTLIVGLGVLLITMHLLKTSVGRDLSEIVAMRYKAWKENYCPIISVE